MSTGKTYSTKYLLDSNNNRGAEGQVLSTTSTGIDWVDANTVPGTGLWLENGNDIYNSNSGNVGIGATNPVEKLQINSGDVLINNSSISTLKSGGSLYLDLNTFGSLGGRNFRVQNNGTVHLNIDSAGNVGIQNTLASSFDTWQRQLVVGSGSADAGITLYHGSGSGNQGAIVFADGNTGTNRYRGSISYNGADEMKFFTSTLERMRIDSSGLINFSKTATTATAVASINHASNDFLYINGGTAGTAIGDDNQSTRIVFYNNDYIRFDAAGSSNVMRITSAGDVGIGTTSPQTLLNIESTTAPTLRISNGGGTSPAPKLEFFRQNGVSSYIQYDVANKILVTDNAHASGVINYKINGSEKMRIDSSGKVGIGTTTPSEKLEVAGNGFINGDLSVSNSFIDSNGNSGSSGQVLTSTSSGTSWSGASGDINIPTQLNLSLGEGYASNIREFLYRNRYRVSPTNLSYRYALHFENPSMPEPNIELLPIGGRSDGGLIGTAAAGLLFNISPRSTTLNTSGIFKTQRNTTATVVGSDQYIDIVDINEPRIDFTETTTGDFLMEPSSTNRTVSSVDFSTSSWVRDGVTISSFEGDAPDGSDEASTITEISGNVGRHSCYQVVTSSTSLINTFSFFAKYNGTAQFISLVLSNTTTWNSQFVVDLKNGVITKEASPSSSFTNTNKLEKHGDGWYRLISTIEGDFAGDNIYSRIVMSNVAVPPYPPLNTYTGRNNYNILIWGAQLEEQAFATSFIPTTISSTATRGTEASQGVQAHHGTYSSGNPQGTLFAEMSALGDNDNTAYNVDTKISLSNTANTFNDYVTIGFSRFDGNVFAEIASGGTLQTVNFGATGVDKTKMNKYALAWNDGLMRFFVNGVQTNSEGVSAPNINTLQFSSAVTSSQRFIGRVKSLKVYKEMLTAEQLGTLSSWSSFDEMALSQNYTIY
jgi:hypothetical protein